MRKVLETLVNEQGKQTNVLKLDRDFRFPQMMDTNNREIQKDTVFHIRVFNRQFVCIIYELAEPINLISSPVNKLLRKNIYC